jgi:beta-glucosidase
VHAALTEALCTLSIEPRAEERFLLTLPLLAICNLPRRGCGTAVRDPSQPIGRIHDLIGRLTLEARSQPHDQGIPRLGIPAWGGWNQTLHGVWSRADRCSDPGDSASWDRSWCRRSGTPCRMRQGAVQREEAEPRFPHGLVFRSPVINISAIRVGPDPGDLRRGSVLTGRMAVAYVHGLQGWPRHLKSPRR